MKGYKTKVEESTRLVLSVFLVFFVFPLVRQSNDDGLTQACYYAGFAGFHIQYQCLLPATMEPTCAPFAILLFTAAQGLAEIAADDSISGDLLHNEGGEPVWIQLGLLENADA